MDTTMNPTAQRLPQGFRYGSTDFELRLRADGDVELVRRANDVETVYCPEDLVSVGNRTFECAADLVTNVADGGRLNAAGRFLAVRFLIQHFRQLETQRAVA